MRIIAIQRRRNIIRLSWLEFSGDLQAELLK